MARYLLISRLSASLVEKTKRGRKAEKKDFFGGFSSDWGGKMTTEDYADSLRGRNVENTRTVESW